jgi:SET domain-containing protein
MGDYLYASRDIEVGEEITIDYSSFDDDFILYKDTLIN